MWVVIKGLSLSCIVTMPPSLQNKISRYHGSFRIHLLDICGFARERFWTHNLSYPKFDRPDRFITDYLYVLCSICFRECILYGYTLNTICKGKLYIKVFYMWKHCFYRVVVLLFHRCFYSLLFSSAGVNTLNTLRICLVDAVKGFNRSWLSY